MLVARAGGLELPNLSEPLRELSSDLNIKILPQHRLSIEGIFRSRHNLDERVAPDIARNASWFPYSSALVEVVTLPNRVSMDDKGDQAESRRNGLSKEKERSRDRAPISQTKFDFLRRFGRRGWVERLDPLAVDTKDNLAMWPERVIEVGEDDRSALLHGDSLTLSSVSNKDLDRRPSTAANEPA